MSFEIGDVLSEPIFWVPLTRTDMDELDQGGVVRVDVKDSHGKVVASVLVKGPRPAGPSAPRTLPARPRA